MDIALDPDEILVRKSGANLQRGLETVGGHLFLTDQRLVFRPHGFNVQSGVTDIPLADIVGTRLAWTKLFGKIPLAPNTLEVQTAAGVEFAFVVSRRTEWASALEACLPDT
ncbi:GRAM domain-containing protein [Paramicrobacterium humi]|nr:GRAM domain-containing protein [Microbacterium humi]